ncbi:hypothetical protein BDB00DRAFT_750487, partial [Zychaea mexicana]|uniref:uncharacterized protein n=1 Tax=Zychaea mexicana TaxID=64656 RepID=UPI0022FDB443
ELDFKVTQKFVLRSIRYCIDIPEETNVQPILVIFNVDGITGKKFFEKTFSRQNEPFYTQHCHPWARFVYLYNADSIACHITSTPLQPIVALTYFFMQRQQYLLALDVFDNPTMFTIY